MKHIKIGVDMDDILFDINPQIVAYYNNLKGENHTTENIKEYYLEKLFGISGEEMHDILEGFYASSYHENGEPIQGSKDGVATLQKYDLILITARNHTLEGVTLRWLTKHFPNVFSATHLVGIPRGGAVTTKGELAQKLGIKVFIEDSLTNALNIASYGIPVVLLDKVWNQGTLPPHIYRVFSWQEIIEKVEELAHL